MGVKSAEAFKLDKKGVKLFDCTRPVYVSFAVTDGHEEYSGERSIRERATSGKEK